MVRMIYTFYRTHRILRVAALLLAGVLALAAFNCYSYVIDIEFDGPGRHIQEMEHERDRGRDEYERRGNGESLNEREGRDATHYEVEHMA